jgi:hypothetical protein
MSATLSPFCIVAQATWRGHGAVAGERIIPDETAIALSYNLRRLSRSAAVTVILFAPQADLAYAGALGFTAGTHIAAVLAAIIAFAALPGSDSFAAFAATIRLYLVPAAALETQPWQRATFTLLSLGTEIIRLRPVAHRLGLGNDLETALAALAHGQNSTAIARLVRLDGTLAGRAGAGRASVRGCGSILAISEVLSQHAAYLNAEAPG